MTDYQCNVCGKQWSFPVPSGRCPYEDKHSTASPYFDPVYAVARLPIHYAIEEEAFLAYCEYNQEEPSEKAWRNYCTGVADEMYNGSHRNKIDFRLEYV